MNRYAKFVCILLPIMLILGLIFSTEANLASINNVCLFILADIYLTCIWYFVIVKYLFKNNKIEHKNIIVAFVISMILVLLLPFQYKNVVKENRIEKIKQKATSIYISQGQRNQNSKGNEIYIESVRIQQNDYNMYELKLTEGWEFVDDRLYTDNKNAQPIDISFRANDDIEIYVRKNENSGSVRINYCGYEKEFDLYSENEIKKVKIDIDSVIPADILSTRIGVRFVVFYICYFMITFSLVYIATTLLILRKKKENLDNEKEN